MLSESSTSRVAIPRALGTEPHESLASGLARGQASQISGRGAGWWAGAFSRSLTCAIASDRVDTLSTNAPAALATAGALVFKDG